ncbi:MAG: hypothetical protein WDN72_04430 [Alphaproteobacteria bacterium]
MNTQSDHASKEELHKLGNQLEHLITHHHLALKEENVLDEVETLQQWVEGCHDGSRRAERKLYQDGLSLLETVKQKLTLAMQEEHRMTEESPAVAVSTKGRHAERLAQATSTAHDALQTLTQISEEGAAATPAKKAAGSN